MENNPYQTPESNLLEPNLNEDKLASRWTRFGAVFIDGIIYMAVIMPILYLFGFWDLTQEASFVETLLINLLGFGVFSLINFFPLLKYGQTIGKRVLGIKIATMDGQVPSLVKLLIFRTLPTYIIAVIPVVGGLLYIIEVLFIYRQDKRCVHDLIAGTQVLKA